MSVTAYHNFSAGPGALPAGVTRETQAALGQVPGVGLPLLGVSHRSRWFGEVVAEAEEHFRVLLNLHYVSNETVEGLQFHRVLGHEGVLRICDMSSDFLSRPMDATQFGLIYAHAQKNLGPSGVTVVVVHNDIVRRTPDGLPSMLDYRCHAAAHSIYNTPPVFAIYVTMLVARWLRREIGGLAAMEAINRAKAARLYAAIDGSGDFYRGSASVADRSLMNVVFDLPTAALEAAFVREAEAVGLHGLDGHRTRGGVRASLYNAVTPAAVAELTAFMDDFRERHVERAFAEQAPVTSSAVGAVAVPAGVCR